MHPCCQEPSQCGIVAIAPKFMRAPPPPHPRKHTQHLPGMPPPGSWPRHTRRPLGWTQSGRAVGRTECAAPSQPAHSHREGTWGRGGDAHMRVCVDWNLCVRRESPDACAFAPVAVSWCVLLSQRRKQPEKRKQEKRKRKRQHRATHGSKVPSIKGALDVGPVVGTRHSQRILCYTACLRVGNPLPRTHMCTLNQIFRGREHPFLRGCVVGLQPTGKLPAATLATYLCQAGDCLVHSTPHGTDVHLALTGSVSQLGA